MFNKLIQLESNSTRLKYACLKTEINQSHSCHAFLLKYLQKKKKKKMAGLSIWHVIIFLVVVVLLFGTSKLKNLGKDVGGAVKDFKKSMRDETEENAQLHTPRTIDAEVKTAERSSAKS